VVERQLGPGEVGEEAGFGRVVAAGDVAAGGAAQVHRRDGVAARVTPRSGVNSEQLHRLHLQAGLLTGLADARRLAGFADLHETAG
jgi:hypothetical protein